MINLEMQPPSILQHDWRNIETGSEIPKEGYCDQPYIVVTDDGHWLCVLTTGPDHEGDHRQHIVSTISPDQGQTWSDLVEIEPPGPPEASWVTPLKVPGRRIYVFYTYNGDNVREIPGDEEWVRHRVDTLGHLMFKYSDDGGRSWSKERYEVPVREMQIDRNNSLGGAVRFFWGVGKPLVHQGAVYIGFAKVRNFVADGFMAESQGIFLKSSNLLTEPNPNKIEWKTLPDGELGLRSPSGPVADEHNLVGLTSGDLYCTYRTIEGYLCAAYSRDGGHTWQDRQYATYGPESGSRPLKHPRAAGFVRRFSNGKYLLWFHNHGTNLIHSPMQAYKNRNPGWLAGGVEKNGFIHWSQPEIALYEDDPATRISYPDFVEENGRYWITETQKTIARIHPLNPTLLEGMWQSVGETEPSQVSREGMVLECLAADLKPGSTIGWPCLPDLTERGGFSLEIWLKPAELVAAQTLFDSCDFSGKGIRVSLTSRRTIRISLNDGKLIEECESDAGLVEPARWHHVVITLDGGPKIVTFVVNGELCDGGTARQYGWHRFPPALGDLNSAGQLRLAPDSSVALKLLRVYSRYLCTWEAVDNYRASLNIIDLE